MKSLSVVLLVMVIFPLSAGCAITNKYDSYYGKVIDAETKEPIEGAAILIVYKTGQYGLAGSVSHFEDAEETLTDKNGEFKIPAKRVNTLRLLSSWEGHPEIRIFKPGYGCYPMHKDVTPKFDYGSLPSEQHVIIKLPLLKTKEERLENYRNAYLSPSVPTVKYKNLLHLINKEAIFLGLKPDTEPE